MKSGDFMIIERYTIMNGIMYTMRDNKFKISNVTNTHGFSITLKNIKTNRNKRWLITSYELTDKEIVIKLPDDKTKRYQANEWTIVHTSIHYF